MGHHLQDYPRHRFLSDGYTLAKTDNTTAYYPVIVLAPVISCYLSSYMCWTGWICAFISTVSVLKFADWLHVRFHTRGCSLEKFQWFNWLRRMHYFHHRGTMRHNYAIADFFADFMLLGINFS